MRQRPILPFLLFVGALFVANASANSTTLPLSDGSEINIQVIGSGNDRVLWLPSEFGFRGNRELILAEKLASTNVQVWITDLHSSYFLPPGRNSLTEIPVNEIAELINLAQPKNGRLFILSTGRGAALSLMAARRWQSTKQTGQHLGGLILFHPNLHAIPPQPGETAKYLPVAKLTNLPIYLIQPGNSAKRWYLPELVEQLQQSGSDVFTRIIPNVSDGFHLRPDFTDHEQQVSDRLPAMLVQSFRLLNGFNQKPRVAASMAIDNNIEWHGNAFRHSLQPYPGEPMAPPLTLHDLEGKRYALADYRDKVVLLNFWATWCPPCVKEIPSLGRLQEKLAKAQFVVLSVDIGEQPDAVAAFLKKIPARFPVLLDQQGATVKPWNIRAFPTTFLLDKEGRIRYAYFGALEWDENSVVETIRQLLL